MSMLMFKSDFTWCRRAATPATMMTAPIALTMGIHKGVAFRTFVSFLILLMWTTTWILEVGIPDPSWSKGNPVTLAVIVEVNVNLSVFSCYWTNKNY